MLTYFSRDPLYEEKHAIWKSSDRSAHEPEKVHFVRGFHRGLELFGQHRLAVSKTREAIQALQHLLIVEGPNDVIRLDTLGVPSFAICSNRITPPQVEKIARWCRDLGVIAVCGCSMATPRVKMEPSEHYRTITALSGATSVVGHQCDQRFKDRQPESLTPKNGMIYQLHCEGRTDFQHCERLLAAQVRTVRVVLEWHRIELQRAEPALMKSSPA